MILCMTPFAPPPARDLGAAYNDAMRLLGPDDWGCFLDHDAAWTTRDWHRQITEAIAALPDAGAIVACSNRIAAFWQQAGDRDSHDMAAHRRFGSERAKLRTLLDATDTQGFGGVAFATSRRAWEQVGGFVSGLLCVDHQYHFALRRAGLRVYLHEGLYVYHWRRAFGDDLPSGCPRAKGCPCRGPERTPTRRITLP